MQTTIFKSANFKRKSFQAVSYGEVREKKANSVEVDEVALNEPPHQNLCCLQIQLVLVLVHQVLIKICYVNLLSNHCKLCKPISDCSFSCLIWA